MINDIVDRLGLDRPLLFFDTETTGLSIRNDRIIQIGYAKYFPGGAEVLEASMLFNPQQPIPAGATAIHGISDADVREAPLFSEKAQELFDLFKDCYLSGFNISGFDLPLIKEEFARAGLAFSYKSEDIIDAKVIYHCLEPRTLSSAYKYYCGKAHDEAHDALGDVKASAEVLYAQLEMYGLEKLKKAQSEGSVDRVDSEGKFYWRDGRAHFSFSKFRHQPLEKVWESEPGFLEWMLTADFSDEVKGIIKDMLAGKAPKK